MRIKVGNDYLDYDGSITVDRQAFTFEDISAYQGDRSYQFNLPKTSNNISILGLQTINVLTKTIYNRVECELFDDLNSCYRGFLRVEKVTDTIDVAFVTGNYEWINELGSFVKDIPELSSYDMLINDNNVVDSFDGTTSILFPLVDRGVLSTRGTRNLYLDDFQPFIRVRDVIKEIFQFHRFKITGELLNDPLYNKLIVTSNILTKEREDAVKRECYVGNASQVFVSDSGSLQATFGTGDFVNSTNGNWDNSTFTYTSDAEMMLRIDVGIEMTSHPGVTNFTFSIIRDGVTRISYTHPDDEFVMNKTFFIRVVDGTELEFFISFNAGTGTVSSTIDINVHKFYKAYGASLVGNMRSIDFVTNVFNVFNVVPEFDVVSKTLTANLFKNIHTKTEVDLSEYFNSCTYDYREFISRYGKASNLKYAQGSESLLQEYNEENRIEYGAGSIDVDNDFITPDQDVVQLGFSSVRTVFNNCLGGYFPKLNYVEMTDGNEYTDDDRNLLHEPISRGQLARFESKNARINGFDFSVLYSLDLLVIEDILPIEIDEDFTSATEQVITDIESEEVVLMAFEPNVAFSDVSEYESFVIKDIESGDGYSGLASIGYAYFVKPETNAATNFPQTPAFGLPNEFTQYQLTAKDVYYRDVQNVLNDPVKVKAVMYLPYSVFLSLSSHVPYRLHTKEFNALFYLNKVSGYRGSQYPCILELIKL